MHKRRMLVRGSTALDDVRLELARGERSNPAGWRRVPARYRLRPLAYVKGAAPS